jgi:hypothetical protein
MKMPAFRPMLIIAIRSLSGGVFVGSHLKDLSRFSAAASFLSVVGLLLAFSGMYAAVAFLVMQRTHEFGIRIALRAMAGQIVSGILSETLQTAALGISAGLVRRPSLLGAPCLRLRPPSGIGAGYVLRVHKEKGTSRQESRPSCPRDAPSDATAGQTRGPARWCCTTRISSRRRKGSRRSATVRNRSFISSGMAAQASGFA